MVLAMDQMGLYGGGEFLLCKGNQYQRLAHIHAAPLPGGEKAVSEPWRQAYGIFVIIMAMISLLYIKSG